jgi:hypothetical protein
MMFTFEPKCRSFMFVAFEDAWQAVARQTKTRQDMSRSGAPLPAMSVQLTNFGCLRLAFWTHSSARISHRVRGLRRVIVPRLWSW